MPEPASISHWFAQIAREDGPQAFAPRERLIGSRNAEVCIVGAGYTGLWTAYELLRARPDLAVVVLEARMAGYGASGRNGGAVIATLNGSRDYWARRGGTRDAAVQMERAIQETLGEVSGAVAREGIDCTFSQNGVVVVARSELESERLQASIAEDREWSLGADDSQYLSTSELTERIEIAGAVGAQYSPHCASIHPGRLVRGLAKAVERLGGAIYENTPVTSIQPGLARTARGEVRASVVVRATEAYSDSIRELKRSIVPVQTSMLVTEEIPDDLWKQIGWRGREALLAEHPFLHLQHTADGRITIGGDDNRVPYRFGSRPAPDGSAPERVVRMYREELVKLFPPLAEVAIERSWQGVFGAPRDWAPRVGIDRSTGFAYAGGYVGEGVAASNLAGRTLRDLILEADTELTRLPWVGSLPRRWEPEPLRFIGAGAVWGLRTGGERLEERFRPAEKIVDLGNRLAGFTGNLG